MSVPSRRRGRPVTTSTEHLSSVALQLWAERSYDAVSLSDIGAEAGVNPRTVLRYFPTKSAIVWSAIDTTFADLDNALQATPTRWRLMTRVRHAVVGSVARDSDSDSMRMRMRVIASTPELQGASTAPFVRWRDVIAEFAADSLGQRATDLYPRTVAACVQTATLAALSWWAIQDEGSPGDAVDRALSALSRGFGMAGHPT